MKLKTITYILLPAFIWLLIGCSGTNEEDNSENQNGWQLQKQVTKEIDNLSFTFPSSGYAYDNRDAFVEECIEAIKSDCALLELPNYTELIKIRFVSSREEMHELTGMQASGLSNCWTKEVHLVANIEEEKNEGENLVKPPIKHELMHQISNVKWGYLWDNFEMDWMNEGLATLAENNCNDFNVEQIYRYLLEEDMLISIDSLSNDFYEHEEMIAYHQSAYIVQCLIDLYGIEKFKELWKSESSNFEEVYEVPFSQMEIEINKNVMETYPKTININWDIFKEGCK